MIPLVLLFCISACDSLKTAKEDAPITSEEVKEGPADKSNWETVPLPEGLYNPVAVFGEKGKIILVEGVGIHISEDEGKTWKIIKKGKGIVNCSRDGGKTYSADCDGNKTAKPAEIDTSDANSIEVAVLTDDDRVVFFTVYEHTSGVWSIPLGSVEDHWYVLDFGRAIDDEETVYGIRHDMFSLGDRLVASAYMPPEESIIVSSEDSGRTWKPFYTGRTREFHFIDDKTGFLLGDDIRKTTDGGLTWSKVADMPAIITEFEGDSKNKENDRDVVVSMNFADENRGFIVGSKGFLIVTSDGGKTWEKRDSGTKRDLWSVRSLDADNAWAVGSDGVIIETTDGGANWKMIDLGLGKITYSSLYEHNLFVNVVRREVWIIKEGNVYKKTIR